MLKRKSLPKSRLINPRRDWYIGLTIGAVITSLIVGWSMYIYITNRSANTEGDFSSEASGSVSYLAAEVEEALDHFGIRENNFKELKGEKISVPRPVPVVEVADPETATSSVSDISSSTSTATTTDAEIVTSSDSSLVEEEVVQVEQ